MERFEIVHYELMRLRVEFDDILNRLEENNMTSTTDNILHDMLSEIHARRSELYEVLKLDCERILKQT
jgi:precorrin-4 methylase